MEIKRIESYNMPLDRPANNYIVSFEGEKYLIDAGASQNTIIDIDKIDYILITHSHWDHTFGISGVRGKKICMSRETYDEIVNERFIENTERIAKAFGYNSNSLPKYASGIMNSMISYYNKVRKALDQNDIIMTDECKPIQEGLVSYMKCYGHSYDHVCYIIKNHLFPGDNILPGGNITLLDFFEYNKSMINLYSRNDWDYIHPGHGPEIKRNESITWLSDTITGKIRRLLTLISFINHEWTPADKILFKLYRNLNDLLIFVAARSMLGYLLSLESLKLVEINKKQNPWLIRKLQG